MISRIYLIRHGITEGNQKKWFYGQADLPLADEGKAKLRELVGKGIYPIPDDDWNCWTSGLLRTEETFNILFGKHPHGVINDWREMEFGDYECSTYDDLKGYHQFDKWVNDETGDVALPGGESKNHFAKRVETGLKELIGQHRLKELSHRHSGKRAVSVMVCHGGVISAAMAMMFPGKKANMWDWMVDPGMGYMVELKNGEPAGYMPLKAD